MRLTRRDTLMLATAAAALGAGGPARAADGIGALETRVNDVWGTAVGAARLEIAEAAAIFRNQRLETGEDSAAGVRFIDASKLTLGANANAVVDDYVFAGAASKSAVTLAKGEFRFISGQMPEKNMKIHTPTVVIGIRGTELKIDVYEDGSTELSTVSGAANIVSRATSEALDILAGHSVLADSNGVFGLVRDFIHKSKDEAIERGLNEIRSKIPSIPGLPGIPNPFR
jgi:hypothetical protein